MPLTSILDQIGNTPMVRLRHLSPSRDVQIWVKLEGQNPGGSVKDRAALGMIQGALKTGRVSKGGHIIEATSGNTGIALAMIGRIVGLDVTLVMPDNATTERITTMKAYGAQVILTPAADTIEFSRLTAQQIADKKKYCLLNQFANHDNPAVHYTYTGPEIWNDSHHQISHFVSAMGTTGTIMGVSKYLKEQNDAIQIIGAQPTEGSSIPGIRKWSGDYLPEIYNPNKVDRILYVSQSEAETMARQLGTIEGILCGISGGGAVATCIKLAREIKKGYIVTILPDRADRYLSGHVFG